MFERDRVRRSHLATGLLALLLLLATSRGAHAQSTITLDGNFDDWSGQACISDPQADSGNSNHDLRRFCFANNPNEERAFFMVERWPGSHSPMTVRLVVDTNGDGATDRIIEVNYQSSNNDSRVDVLLYNGQGQLLRTLSSSQDLGASRNEGAANVEWGVTFNDLGIAAFQPIDLRVDLSPGSGQSTVDSSAPVQWSPANALGYPLLLLVAGAGLIGHVMRQRRLSSR